MLKFSSMAKFSIVAATSLSCLAFVPADHQAFGIIPANKAALKVQAPRPQAPRPQAPPP